MIVVVANPSSGRGKAARVLPRVEAALGDAGLEFRVHVSTSADDAVAAARRAAEDGARIVAALGGDGQVGLCANGVIGSEAALAVLPAGTGNDFAPLLGLDRRDPVAAARALADPSIRRIDVVRAETSSGVAYFVNVGGVGFDSEVNDLANRTRWLRGTPKYVWSVFATLARFRPARFSLRVDGERRDLDAMMVAVGNGVSYGGGMRVTPDAVLDDGLLDLCVVGALPKWQFVRTFPKVFSGTHGANPAVTMIRGAEIEVAADRPFDVYGDGERLGGLPARFVVEPARLAVVFAPSAASGALG